MSDARLGILHITDLHAGQPEHDSYFPTIRAAFLRDLELCHHKSGPWDLVIFSGDLAFSGKERQYQQVENFISELQKTIRSIDQSDPIFLAVPGNHDLERQDETNAVADVLANLTTRPKEVLINSGQRLSIIQNQIISD